jgi:2-phospho-L-lactate guanylyltransferase
VTVAVVPVKDLDRAKERLSGRLTKPERRALVLAMLEDVLVTLARVPGIDATLVVTHEPEVVRLAVRIGAETLAEPANRGYSAAVALAARELELRGVTSMLVLPGDVPALQTEEVTTMLQTLKPSPSAVFVPCRDERGTNGALLSPPGALALRFGEPSFHPHVQQARAQGLRVDVLHLPGLSLDLDTPEDLDLFMKAPSMTRTYELLSMNGAP